MYNAAMFRQRKFRSPISWVLLFAVLFNIASPSFAKPGKSIDLLALGAICSTPGMNGFVASGVDRAPGEHIDLLHDGHCQLCTFNPVAWLKPAIAIALPVATGSFSVPVPESTFIAAPHAGCPPPPSHAPPVFS